MALLSIPKPATARPRPSVQPRPLLPVVPPADPGPFPALPSPPRPSPFPNYSLSTHLIPSAHPRLTRHVPLPPPPPPSEDKASRQARVAQTVDHVLALRKRQLDGEDTEPGSTRVLWNCLDRYVRKGAGARGTGLTLFFAHANGLHKETFESTIRHMLAKAEAEGSYEIDEIWTFDAVQHGDSALVNEHNLALLFDWTDNVRDILNFFLHYLPEGTSDQDLPTHLERVSNSETNSRQRNGYSRRSVVAVGHSYGGCSLTHAAYHIPNLFSGLVLVDPVIAPKGDVTNHIRNRVQGALFRRTSWSSREEASRLLKASPFFGAWDDEVFRSYIEHGLTEDANGNVRLKCSGVQEAVVFADGYASWEAWGMVSQLDPRIALKWIIPPYTESVLRDEEMAEDRVWLRPENSSNVLIPTAGHLELHLFLNQKWKENKARL
ncbi:Alpha/beta hydrolase family-domain-containing protein [Amylostereum chailletii]|nr:Alpha/beta hydrolase family-domain-containing protein [Amylostereum chailletii]